MRISDWSSDVCSSDLTERFEYLARLAVIQRMIAVFGVQPSGPFRMFRDEQQPLRLAQRIGQLRRLQIVGSHELPLTTRRLRQHDASMTCVKRKRQSTVIARR